MADRKNLPHDEWMATIKCHNCDQMGHFTQDCPAKKRSPPRSPHRQQQTTYRSEQNNKKHSVGKTSDRRQQREKVKKIYNNILADIGNSSEEESEHTVSTPRVHNTTADNDNAIDNESDSNSEDEFSVNAARAMWNAANLAKEWAVGCLVPMNAFSQKYSKRALKLLSS
jgi:hypothetical protein